MKTARFKNIVAALGRPRLHLPWTAPKDDRELQRALRQNRLLTVHQEPRGGKKDFGVVGWVPGAHSQYFIFPKSLRAYSAARVVALDYTLLEQERSSGRTSAPSKIKKSEAAPPQQSAPANKAPVPDAPREKAKESDPILRQVQLAIDDLTSGHHRKAEKRLKELLERDTGGR